MMAKFKYAVKNGDNILGIMWETEKGEKVFVANNDSKLDLNFDLEVKDATGKIIKDVDLIELLIEILPR